MNSFVIVFSVFLLTIINMPKARGQAYFLPEEAEAILGKPITKTFDCQGKGRGYFADQGMDCKIFHICHLSINGPLQYSFLCGNQTVFNQVTLTCTMPEEAVPCSEAHNYYFINNRFSSRRIVATKNDLE